MSKQKTNYNFTEGNLEVFMNKSIGNIVWITGDKKVLKISEMSEYHIQNIIQWIVDYKKPGEYYLNRSFFDWKNIFKAELQQRFIKSSKRKEYDSFLASKRKVQIEMKEIQDRNTKLVERFNTLEKNEEILNKTIEEYQKVWGF